MGEVMGAAFRGLVRAVRRSPNLFAVAAGLFLFSVPGILLDAALHASGRILSGDPPVAPPPPPRLLAPSIDLWGRFADSGIGVAVAVTIMGAGILLALLGVARVFRPRS